jgi:hypothetical protein
LGFKSLAILRNVNCHNNINSFVVLVFVTHINGSGSCHSHNKGIRLF